MTAKTVYHLALNKLLEDKASSELPLRTAVQLHHVLSCIYEAVLYFGSIRRKVTIDYPKQTISVMVAPIHSQTLDLVRSEVEKLTFVPTAWTVDFEIKDEDCWLDPVVFFMQAPAID